MNIVKLFNFMGIEKPALTINCFSINLSLAKKPKLKKKKKIDKLTPVFSPIPIWEMLLEGHGNTIIFLICTKRT